VSLIANLIAALLIPFRQELFGARRERTVAIIDVGSTVVGSSIALAAVPLGAFVVPVGIVVAGLYRVIAYIPRRERLYAGATVSSGAHEQEEAGPQC
jgi:hypothetical protein